MSGACANRRAPRSSVTNASAISRACREGTHAWIKTDVLDDLVRDEVFLWVAQHADAAEPPAGAAEWTTLAADLAEVHRQRDAAQEMYLLPGADKVKVTKTLAHLGKKADRLEAAIHAERSRDARLTIVDAVRGPAGQPSGRASRSTPGARPRAPCSPSRWARDAGWSVSASPGWMARSRFYNADEAPGAS